MSLNEIADEYFKLMYVDENETDALKLIKNVKPNELNEIFTIVSLRKKNLWKIKEQNKKLTDEYTDKIFDYFDSFI